MRWLHSSGMAGWVSLPAKQSRRLVILRHIAETSFAPAAAYDEPAVNEKLTVWCAGGDVDHVALRRYLVDHGLLLRTRGVYSRDPLALPEPGEAERHLAGTGLD